VVAIGGLALMIGASAYSLAWIVTALIGRDPAGAAWVPLNLLVVFGSMAIAAGLPSLHAVQAKGTLGLVAIAMLFVGFLTAGVARQSVETFTLPVLERVPAGAGLLVMVASPLLFLGLIALGIAIVRAGFFPAWSGYGLIVAALAGAFAAFVPLPPALRYLVPILASGPLAYLGWRVLLAARA
jgi:hypothetical protein